MILKKLKKKNGGYSIIELIIAVSILTMIIGAYGAFQADVFSLNRLIQTGLNNQYEAKKIIRPFANEVRGASFSSQGSYPIAEAATSTLTFYSNIDSDSYVEKIRYFLEGKTFKKGITKPSGSPLAYNQNNEQISQIVHDVVPAQIFYYYDSGYNGTSLTAPLAFPVTPAEVRLIKVILKIDSDPNNKPYAIEVETQVSIRNLKDNR